MAEIDTANAGGVIRAAIVGLLAPLALRSPIRSAQIGGTTQPVGVTYVYDSVRYYIDSALDERMTRLRRRDTSARVATLVGCGWTSELMIGDIYKHMANRRKLRPEYEVEVRQRIESSRTLPNEGDRLEGIVNVLMTNRFVGVLDDLCSRSPHDHDEDDDQNDGVNDDDDEDA
jgi:cysteine sulfinate desulfinase/cysteine desulfurase-like protein